MSQQSAGTMSALLMALGLSAAQSVAARRSAIAPPPALSQQTIASIQGYLAYHIEARCIGIVVPIARTREEVEAP